MADLELDFVLNQLKITKEFDFSELNSLRSQLEQTETPNYLALEKQRLQGSNSLSHQAQLEEWKNANRQIFQWISNSEAIRFSHIVSLNQILYPEGEGKLRQAPIYGATGEFIDFKKLPFLAPLLTENVLRTERCPLRKASQLYQWISTFHPFGDANGRTARLAADFVLIGAGYVPLSFENPFDAMVAIKSNTLHVDGNYGMTKFLKWLSCSYRILMMEL